MFLSPVAVCLFLFIAGLSTLTTAYLLHTFVEKMTMRVRQAATPAFAPQF